MQKNKIVVEHGHTTIVDNNSAKEPNIKRANSTMLDEMQAVYDRVENNSQTVSTMSQPDNINMQNNMNFQGFNQGGLMSLLPLIAGMGGKNMGNISNIMSNLPTGQNGANNMNLISQLLPLLANMKNSTKKQSQNELKIDSLTKADDN